MSHWVEHLTHAVQTAVEQERAFCRQLTDAQIDARQRRISEAELAHRIRSGFPDLETFLAGQGKSERDVVSDSHLVEVEVKYFCGQRPQGGRIPMSDWNWLVGREVRALPREMFARAWVCFFPRCCTTYTVQRRARLEHRDSYWRFQECLSMTAGDVREVLPYSIVTDVVTPTGRNGRQLEPRLRFREEPQREAVLTDHGQTVVAFMIGNSGEDPLWAAVYHHPMPN